LEVLQCLRRHRDERMRCIGAGHSWSPMFVTEGVLYDLRRLKQVELDPAAERVRVGGGCRLRRLLRKLERKGWTLPTLGAITKQTVAGATATGTHGSGSPSLSHFVEEVRVATFDPASGEPYIATFRQGPELRAARCALGALGIVVELVLVVRRRYRIEERVVKTDRMDVVLEEHELHKWPLQQFALLPWSWTYLVFRRRVTTDRRRRFRALVGRIWTWLVNDISLHLALKGALLYAEWRGGRGAGNGEPPIRSFFRYLPRLISTGPARLDDSTAILTMHHDLFRHVEMELFLPESRLPQAIRVIQEIVKLAGGEREAPATLAPISPELRAELANLRGTYTLHYPLFFRRVLPDETLVSMASREGAQEDAWYSISFFTYRKVDEHFARFAEIVARCMIELYGGRLHWGKYFPIPLDMAATAYPRFGEFRNICRKYDPRHRFWYERAPAQAETDEAASGFPSRR
jgi:FAD/FMN-containing dehydrogenase